MSEQDYTYIDQGEVVLVTSSSVPGVALVPVGMTVMDAVVEQTDIPEHDQADIERESNG